MIRSVFKLIALCLGTSLGYAQLTMDQKMADFQALSALYAKRYGPYDWKVKAFNYDLMNIAPWVAQVGATKNDLDFYEVMVSYVASLNDAHSVYLLPSAFVANLNFVVDIYDGKLLVDSINRTRLPAAEFPFLIGYELVSIDGKDAQKLLDGLLQYQVAANPRSTRRLAAELLTIRPQEIMPHAADVPEISSVIFRRPDGNLETYRIPWTKSGLQLTSVGAVPTPKVESSGAIARPPRGGGRRESGTPDQTPAYIQFLKKLQNIRLPDKTVIGFSSLTPIFAASLPSSFQLRLGKSTDPFFSGVFQASGYKIGFIRIPSFEPADLNGALTAFQKEIVYFQANTDGLVVDDMRNPGGELDYMDALVSLLMPAQWNALGFRLRATSEWVYAASSSLTSAQAEGAPQIYLDLLQNIVNEIVAANHEMRGYTKPLPFDDVTLERDPAFDARGKLISYTKPMIVLTDDMSASAADMFAATIQDNGRAPIVGWRTMGAGGNVEAWEAGTYSQGTANVTESLAVRSHDIVTTDYPAAPYIENIGVRPDTEVDYMTRDNLMQNGKPFVDAFVAAIVAQIQKGN